MAPQRSRNMDVVDENHLKKCRWVRVNWLWKKVGRVNFGIILRFNPVVSLLSACIIWGFVAWCIVESDAANAEMGRWKIWITKTFTWMYIGTQDIWAVIIIMLYFSKYSNMKLGKDDEEPEFNDATYFTMLFAAGIGIGLFYFGVGKLAVMTSLFILPCANKTRVSLKTLSSKTFSCMNILDLRVPCSLERTEAERLKMRKKVT